MWERIFSRCDSPERKSSENLPCVKVFAEQYRELEAWRLKGAQDRVGIFSIKPIYCVAFKVDNCDNHAKKSAMIWFSQILNLVLIAHVTIIAERGKVWDFSSKHICCAVFRIDDKDKQTNHDEQSVIPQNINLAADPSCEVFLPDRQLPTKVKERHLQGTGRVLFFYWTKVWSLSSLECISARRASMPTKVQFRPFYRN